MSPSRISPRLPEAKPALRAWQPRCALLLALFLVLATLGPLPTEAAGLAISDSRATFAFSESLTFEARVTGAAPLTEAILFFGRVGYPLVRRVYPPLPTGTDGTLRYVEELEQGQFAPGTLFQYWWECTASDGSTATNATQTFEYTDPRFGWQVLSGERVDLYYYGAAKRGQALAEAGEATIRGLEQDTGVPAGGRVRVYAYESARDMSLALTRRSAAYDDRVLTLGVAVDDHTLLLLGTHRDAQEILAHELSHIIVGAATANPFAGLPRWLDEGLAMYAEGALPDANRQALEQAVKHDQLISLRSMTSYSGQAEDVDLFYGQAYSVVHYVLEEFGRDRMRALLGVFAEGVRQDDALREAFGFGLDRLEDLWRGSLGLEPRPRAQATTTPAGRP